MRISYLRFDLSKVTGVTIQKAYLAVNLWINVGATGSVGVRHVPSDTWGEYTTTWNNAPPVSQTVYDKNNTVAPEGYYFFDVTSPVLASIYKKTVSLALTPEDGREFSVNFDSREMTSLGRRPYLAIVTPNKAPTVQITYPQSNAVVGDVVTIRMSMADEDNDKLDLDLEIDGKLVGTLRQTTSTSTTYNWDTSTVPDGTHTIKTTVSDGKTTAQHQISVIVNNQNLAQQIESLRTQLTRTQSELETVRTERDALQSQVSTLQTQKTSLETQVRNLQGQVTNLQNEKTDLQGQVTRLNTQITNLQNEKTDLDAKLTAANAKIVQKDNEIVALEGNVYRLTNELETMRQDKATLEAKVANLNGEINGLEKTITEKNIKIQNLEANATALQEQIDGLETEKAALQRTVLNMTQTIAGQTSKIDQLQNLNSQQNATIQDRDERIESQAEEIKTLTTEKTALEDRIKKLQWTNTLAIAGTALGIVGAIIAAAAYIKK